RSGNRIRQNNGPESPGGCPLGGPASREAYCSGRGRHTEGMMPVMEDLREVLQSRAHPGLAELRSALGELLGPLLGKNSSPARLTHEQKLGRAVYRLCFEAHGGTFYFVGKCLDPDAAQRNLLVVDR